MDTRKSSDEKISPLVNKFIKILQKKRTFKKVKQLTGIDIERQSHRNLMELYQRLKLANHLPDEIKEKINKEKIHATDILTPAEIIFFKSLLLIPLIANHATNQADKIMKESKTLYSSKELERREIGVPKHTMTWYGEDDFIFFSYSLPEKKEVTEFANRKDASVFYINLDKLAQEDPIAFLSIWTSGHFYAYDNEETFNTILYETEKSKTLVLTSNEVIIDSGLKYNRIYTFEQAGRTLQQTLSRESEISAGRHIKIFHMLRLIEFLRYLDSTTREAILQHPKDRKLISELFYYLFTPGKFELLFPVSFKLNVDVIIEPASNNLDKYDGRQIRYYLIERENELLLRAIKKNSSWKNFRTWWYEKPLLSLLSLLHFAVLRRNYTMTEELLRHGANVNHLYIDDSQRNDKNSMTKHALQDAIELKDFKLIKLLCGDYPKKIDRYNITFSTIVLPVDMYTAIADNLSIEIFDYLFLRYKKFFSNFNYLLSIAAIYENVSVLSYLLKAGANPNINNLEVIPDVNTGHVIPSSGIDGTALTAACKFGSIKSVKLLLDAKADPNVFIKGKGTKQKYGKGETPLLITRSQLKSPPSDLYRSMLTEVNKSRFAHLPIPSQEHYEIIEKLLISAGANQDYTIALNKQFQHLGYACITGKNKNQEKVLLLADKKGYADRTFLSVPGGAVNYVLDNTIRDATARWASLQTGLDLKKTTKKLTLRKFTKTPKNDDDLIEVRHYRLEHPIEEYKAYKNTLNSDYMERRFGGNKQRLENIAFVPLQDIKITLIKYGKIIFPLCTYQDKPISHILSLKIASLRRRKELIKRKNIEFALQLELDPEKLLLPEVKQNNLEKVANLLSFKISFFHNLQNVLREAINLGHYEIAELLLREGAPFNQFIFFVCINEYARISHPEEFVLKLYLLLGKKNTVLDELAKYAGMQGYTKIIALIYKEKNNLLEISSLKAVFCQKIDYIKWIFTNISFPEKSSLAKKLIKNCINGYKSPEKIRIILEMIAYLSTQCIEGIPDTTDPLDSLSYVYEILILNNMDISLQERCLYIMNELIDRDYPASWRMISVYSYIKSKHKEASDIYLSTISRIPTIAMSLAEQKESFEELDRLILQYHDNIRIRELFRDDRYFLNKNINLYLQHAIQLGSYTIVRFILENGFNHVYLNLKFSDYRWEVSPLDYARHLGHTSIVKLLLAHSETLEEKNHLLESTNNLSHAKIVIYSKSPLTQDNQPKTGDVDYASHLTSSLAGIDPKMEVCYNPSDSLLDSKRNTILHLLINAPRTGCAIEANELIKLKALNHQIVVTAIEFAKHVNPSYKYQTLNYFQHADQIIFLDDSDKQDALFFSKKNGLDVVDKILTASVIPVPPTITVSATIQKKKSSDIMCFGMLRSGKGFAHILHLAELIKENKSDLVNKKTMYIVGSVQKHKTRRHGTVYDSTLYKLLTRLYPEHKDSFIDKTPTELIAIYQKIQTPPNLPIKLLVDIDEEKLEKIFEQCEYAFYPAYRGATLRNSSIATDLAFSCVIYSHISEITPPCLLKNGEYHQSMVLFESDSYKTYAKNVLDDIIYRENDKKKNITLKSLNEKTREMGKKLLNNELSLSCVTNKHIALYKTLLASKSNVKNETSALGIFKIKNDDARLTSPVSKKHNSTQTISSSSYR
jgi:ankyrin repeat protein